MFFGRRQLRLPQHSSLRLLTLPLVGLGEPHVVGLGVPSAWSPRCLAAGSLMMEPYPNWASKKRPSSDFENP